MPTYILLCNWTQQGIQNIKDSPSRLVKANGGQIKDFYMTMGQYDMVITVQAPNDETLAKSMLAIASAGGVRSQTLRAFPEGEYKEIIGGLP
jgi:uncharacterized protein with GYD domain